MAGKSHGMGDQLWIGGNDLGADTNSLTSLRTGLAGTLPATAITQDAEARFPGLRDGDLTVVSYWNPDAGAAHSVYSALPTTDVVCTYAHTQLIGGPTWNVVAKQVDYQGNHGQDGSFLLTIPFLPNSYGVGPGYQATPGMRTDASATAAAAVSPLDQASISPGAFGAIVWVHLKSLASGTVTIKLQESSDNSGDAYTDVTGATTAGLSSAPTGVRIATGAIDVERYLKVVTTGTFTDAVFSVSVWRHKAETLY
jgi:hypothetical protein